MKTLKEILGRIGDDPCAMINLLALIAIVAGLTQYFFGVK